jgi:hypothetical protein
MDIERWFQGEVVDIDDPLKMGRVKVKELIGHSLESNQNLFWCHIIMPPTGANAKGIGTSAIGLSLDSKVLGFKVNSKLSYIVGSFPYAVDDSDHSVSGYARGKGPVEKNYITEFGERETEYAAKYPYNMTVTTDSGHVLELDDTPKAERIHVYHKSGSYIEIFPDGTIITKSVKDSVSVTVDRHSISVIKGTLQIVSNEAGIEIISNKDIDLVSKNGVINIQGQQVAITGDLYIDGNIDITGTLKSTDEIQSSIIKLTKHRHDPITGAPIPAG